MSHLVQFLSSAGDGSGTINVNGNYASAADEFYIECPAGKVLELHRLLVTVRDTGAFDAEEYGNGVALTNGISITVEDDDGNVKTTLTPEPVLTNTDWGTYCYDVDIKAWGTGDEFLLARWTFTKFGGPVTLLEGEQLIVTVNDDLTPLVGHYFVVEGQSNNARWTGRLP